MLDAIFAPVPPFVSELGFSSIVSCVLFCLFAWGARSFLRSRRLPGLSQVCGWMLLAGSSAAALGQATGTVSGFVSDPSNGRVPAAQIALKNNDTGAVMERKSTGDGSYVFPLVAPGTYSLQVTLAGFKESATEDVQVLVNTTTRVDVHLVVGSVGEEVSVSAQNPLVETGNATLGTVIGHQDIIDLPLNGRNFAQLGVLIPGVVAAPSGLGGLGGNATPGGFGDTTGSYNVNGQRNQSNNFLLDGAPNNDSFNSGFVMRPPPDDIEEFKIITHSYEAQYGRNAGSVVNVVTRQGTNEYHGSVWEFNREAAYAAKNYFTTPGAATPAYIQNQFGGAGGGKILRNRLFAFGYYEGFRLKDATSNVLNVPTPTAAERTGDFTAVSTPITDPLTGQQFAYNGVKNRIDPARISPVSAYLLKNYVATPGANGFVTGSPANIDNRNMYGLRADLKLGPHALLGRYLRAHQNLFSPLAPSNFPVAGNVQDITLQDALGSDTWTINSRLINVGRYSWQGINGVPNVTSGANLTSAGYAFASSNQSALGLPNVTVTSFFTQGDLQQPFAKRQNSVDTIADDLTWSKGKHTFMFGGEIRRDTINLLYINRPNGAFTFNNFFTGYALSDFLLGYPYMFQQGSGNPALNGSSWTYASYAQDQFRLNPRLTIEAGVRYEVNRPYVEQNNHLAALHPGQQSTVQPNAPVGLVYPGDINTPRSTYYADTNNIAPRLGVVFDPVGDGKTVFRAAYGLFYDTVPGQGDFFQNGTLAPPFQPLQEIDFYTRAKTAASPTYFSSPYAGVTAGPVGFPPNLTFIGWSLPHSFQTPRVQQYNFGLQHQLTSTSSFEIGYVGSRGDFLPIFIEVNPTNYVAAASGTNLYTASTRAVFPSLGLTRPTFSAAQTWYDSLQASYTLRPFHGLHATGAYTWSHSIDDSSGLNIGGDSRPILPVTIGSQQSIATALQFERGNSLYDARNRGVISFGYTFPKLTSSNLAERLILGDWQVNGIFQAQSGSPFTVVNSSTTAQSLTFRPNLTCNPNSNAPHGVGTATTFININCFSLPSTGAKIINNQSGNEPRNIVLGPAFNNTDASLFKNFATTEHQQLELRFEVFNVFNEAHFAQPSGTFQGSATTGLPTVATGNTFGKIVSTIGNDQRIIQIAAKYSF